MVATLKELRESMYRPNLIILHFVNRVLGMPYWISRTKLMFITIGIVTRMATKLLPIHLCCTINIGCQNWIVPQFTPLLYKDKLHLMWKAMLQYLANDLMG